MDANEKILTEDVKNKLRLLGINYYVLHNSKSNELAFVSYTNNKKNREFEVKFLKNGSYKVSTRYLGYERIISTIIGATNKTKDPDQRRYSFSVVVDTKEELNLLLLKMLNNGYDANPKIENI